MGVPKAANWARISPAILADFLFKDKLLNSSKQILPHFILSLVFSN